MAYVPSIRLYIEEALSNNIQITLPPSQSHYLITVMRQKEGRNLSVFNGKDGEWEACINVAHKKHCTLQITKQLREQEASPKIALAYAPVKNVAQYFIVQKATEMGITDLYPIITEHAIVRKVNMEKLKSNAIEAAEQCERLSVPKIHDIQTLEGFIKNLDQETQVMFCDETGNAPAIKDKVQLNNLYNTALIGPEGGFSSQEQSLLSSHPQVISISMGPRILRADTAAIAALTLLQITSGDWNKKPREKYGK